MIRDVPSHDRGPASASGAENGVKLVRECGVSAEIHGELGRRGGTRGHNPNQEHPKQADCEGSDEREKLP
jgi:hypothetical protein